MAKVKADVKKTVKVKVVKAKAKPAKVKAVKPKKIVKKAKAKIASKNPNGTYTIHMRDQLAWLHQEAKKRGMHTSGFVKECINYFIKKRPATDKSKVA